MSPHRIPITGAVLSAVLVLTAPVAGATPTATTIRTSVNSDATQGNDMSGRLSRPAISADGRFVAFVSDASDLVVGDTNHVRDIFVRDLLTRATELVSVASDETLANSDSATPSISADGHAVAFMSFASNLVANDTNGHFDVFVRDRTAGTTVLASVRPDGVQGNQDSLYTAISGDGAFVAFPSDASNLVRSDTNNRRDVFLRDLGSDRLMRVSVAWNGDQANGQSVGSGVRGGLVFGPAINFDGTRIA